MIRWIGEPRRGEDVADDRLDLRTVLQVDLRDSFDECRIRGLDLADEEAPELARQTTRGFWMHRQRVDQIDSLLITVGFSTRGNRPRTIRIDRERKRLGAGFMLPGPPDELLIGVHAAVVVVGVVDR